MMNSKSKINLGLKQSSQWAKHIMEKKLDIISINNTLISNGQLNIGNETMELLNYKEVNPYPLHRNVIDESGKLRGFYYEESDHMSIFIFKKLL